MIHGASLDPLQTDQLFPAMYVLAALALLVLHALQNRSEQIRELQVKWSRALAPYVEHVTSRALTPTARRIRSINAGISGGISQMARRSTYLLPPRLRPAAEEEAELRSSFSEFYEERDEISPSRPTPSRRHVERDSSDSSISQHEVTPLASPERDDAEAGYASGGRGGHVRGGALFGDERSEPLLRNAHPI